MEAQRFENGPLGGEVEGTRRARGPSDAGGLGCTSPSSLSWHPHGSEKSKDGKRDAERVGRLSGGVTFEERLGKGEEEDADGACVVDVADGKGGDEDTR